MISVQRDIGFDTFTLYIVFMYGTYPQPKIFYLWINWAHWDWRWLGECGGEMHTYDFDQIRLTIALTSAVTCFMHKNTAQNESKLYYYILLLLLLSTIFIYMYAYDIKCQYTGALNERISGVSVIERSPRIFTSHPYY